MQGGNLVEHGGRILYRLAVYCLQNVSRLDAGLVRRTAAQYPGDHGAAGGWQFEGFCQFGRDVLDFHPDPAARDGAILDDLLHDLLRQADRNGETDAERAAGPGENCAVDADQVAVAVHQCATGVAGIDGGIGLDEIFIGVDAQMAAPQRADDAHGDGLADAEGVADGQHDIAHLDFLRSPEGNGGKIGKVDLDHGQIGFRIGADDLGRGGAAIGKGDFDLVRRFHDVMIGQDIALAADDDPRAQTGLALRFCIRAVAEEMAENRIIHQGVARARGFPCW